MKFEIGMEVKLIATFNDSYVNPCWGGKFGHVKGEITEIDTGQYMGVDILIQVLWANGSVNYYRAKDLQCCYHKTAKCKNCKHRLQCITN